MNPYFKRHLRIYEEKPTSPVKKINYFQIFLKNLMDVFAKIDEYHALFPAMQKKSNDKPKNHGLRLLSVV